MQPIKVVRLITKINASMSQSKFFLLSIEKFTKEKMKLDKYAVGRKKTIRYCHFMPKKKKNFYKHLLIIARSDTTSQVLSEYIYFEIISIRRL